MVILLFNEWAWSAVKWQSWRYLYWIYYQQLCLYSDSIEIKNYIKAGQHDNSRLNNADVIVDLHSLNGNVCFDPFLALMHAGCKCVR